MTIEVRQIQIKASVTKRDGHEEGRFDPEQVYQMLKGKIREECRQLISEMLREERER